MCRLFAFCDSGGIQTHNLLIRSQMLYSVELRNLCSSCSSVCSSCSSVISLKASAKVRTFSETTKLFSEFFQKKCVLPVFSTSLLLFRGDELVAFAVDIDDFYLRIVLQVLAQLGDVDIHRAGVEIVVVNPDGLQGEVALQNLVGM